MKNEISTEAIIKALEITLDYNIASFNGTTYRQVRGAAMGPKNSCEYADCAMDEIDTLVNCDTEHGPPHRPAFWGRLRDLHGLDGYCGATLRVHDLAQWYPSRPCIYIRLLYRRC